MRWTNWYHFGSLYRRAEAGVPGPGKRPRCQRVRPRLEVLEGRWLPAGIKPYPIPTSGPGSDEGITVGPDNNLWITERDADKVARLNTAGSFLNTYNVPTAGAGPNNITRGPDGNLWFTETNVGHVAKVTPTGTFTEYSSGITPGANPYGITRGPDGNLWFTEFFADKIGRITTSGTVTEFTYTGGTNPGFSHIVTGPDNNLWFTEPFQSRIGRITTGGTITHFAAPGPNPAWIVVGPDNNLWFTEGDAKIVRMNTSGTVTGTFAVPNGSDPYGLAVGADGNLWFVDRFANFVGRITTAGVVTGEFTIPAPGLTNPGGAVSGPDGNIWFLGATSPDVWQVVLDKPLTATPRTVTPTEGSEFTGVVASFTDADTAAAAGDFTARIDWGNGNVTAGVVTSNGTGGFNVTGTNTYTEEGTDAITVTITDINDSKDVGGSTAVAHSTANVADAALSAVPITFMFPVGTEGFPITNLVLANFVDGGGPEPFANYTVTINWGDGTLPTTGTLTRTGLIFSVAGSHTYAEEDPRTIQVTVKDEGGSMAAVSVPITLYDAGLSPTAVPVTATEGATFSGVVATFTDSGGAEVVGDYGATINWGDNSAPTSGTITVSAGTFTVRGTHTYAEEGFYTISMSIQHEASGTGLFIVPANVADAALSASGVAVSATEGGLANPLVATFTDAGGPEVATNYNALIDWGDGHTSSGLVTFSGGVFQVTGLNAYGEEGMYTVSVTIRDEGGSMITATSTATVADAPLSAAAVTFTTAVATEGFAFSNLTLAYFLDGGGYEPAANYTATIDWGDTTTSAGTVVPGGVWGVTGGHTYTEEGSYTVSVTIKDEGGSMVSVSTTLVVADAALAPTPVAVGATEGVAFTGLVGTFTDTGGPEDPNANYVATIYWGDGSAPDTGVITLSGTTFSITGSHTYAEEGSYLILIAVDHEGTGTCNFTAAATVGDAPLSASGFDVSATTGVLFTANVANFTDAGGSDNIASYAAYVDWGDGSVTAGLISPDGSGGYNVSGTYAYAAAGSYTITVTIVDEAGSTATTMSTATVTDPAFDPLLMRALGTLGQPRVNPWAATEWPDISGSNVALRDRAHDGFWEWSTLASSKAPARPEVAKLRPGAEAHTPREIAELAFGDAAFREDWWTGFHRPSAHALALSPTLPPLVFGFGGNEGG